MSHWSIMSNLTRHSRNRSSFWKTITNHGFVAMCIGVCGLIYSLALADSRTGNSLVIPYQGYLTSNAGSATDGNYMMSFALYDAPQGGTLLWGPEIHPTVAISNGNFVVQIGNNTLDGVPLSIWESAAYIEITIEDETLSPRQKFHQPSIALGNEEFRTFTPLSVSDRSSPLNPFGTHRWSANGISIMKISFTVPLDYSSGDLVVRMYYFDLDTSAGTKAYFDRTINVQEYLTGVEESIPAESSIYEFGSRTGSFTIPEGNFAAGDLIFIQEIRNGDHPNDNAGRLDSRGVSIEYIGR